jgi:hypothetical protein
VTSPCVFIPWLRCTDFDIVQILALATVDIQGNPSLIHIRHYGSPTVTLIALVSSCSTVVYKPRGWWDWKFSYPVRFCVLGAFGPLPPPLPYKVCLSHMHMIFLEVVICSSHMHMFFREFVINILISAPPTEALQMMTMINTTCTTITHPRSGCKFIVHTCLMKLLSV